MYESFCFAWEVALAETLSKDTLAPSNGREPKSRAPDTA